MLSFVNRGDFKGIAVKGFSFWLLGTSISPPFCSGAWREDMPGCSTLPSCPACAIPKAKLAFSVLVGTVNSRSCFCKWAPNAPVHSMCLPGSSGPPVFTCSLCFPACQYQLSFLACQLWWTYTGWVGGVDTCRLLSQWMWNSIDPGNQIGFLAIQCSTPFSNEVWTPNLGGSTPSYIITEYSLELSLHLYSYSSAIISNSFF